VCHIPDIWRFLEIWPHYVKGVVGAAVIHHNHFPTLLTLRYDRIERPRQQMGAIKGANDDRKEGSDRGRRSFIQLQTHTQQILFY
jgi:hypothetical protein